MRKYVRVSNGLVVELLNTDGDIATMFPPELVWVDVTDTVPAPSQNWFADSTNSVWSFTAPATSAPTLADAAAALTDAVQAWLDTTVRANGYDSVVSCVSYRGSTEPQWDADATAAMAWRDAVWKAAFQWQQDAIANPPATFPTPQEVIAQLPQPEAFGWVAHTPGSSG